MHPGERKNTRGGRYPGAWRDPREQFTGTYDEQYNLVSVLYHALHGAENCSIYAADAEAAGREDLATFFREAETEQVHLAEWAKGWLGLEKRHAGGGQWGPPAATPGTKVTPESTEGPEVSSPAKSSSTGGRHSPTSLRR